jgi:signal transduction histidine kinase
VLGYVKLNKFDESMQLFVVNIYTGVPEDDILHLFSRIHLVHSASACLGSGLGFAIVRAIEDQH